MPQLSPQLLRTSRKGLPPSWPWPTAITACQAISGSGDLGRTMPFLTSLNARLAMKVTTTGRPASSCVVITEIDAAIMFELHLKTGVALAGGLQDERLVGTAARYGHPLSAA